MNRRSFIASALAVLTLGRLPKAKATPREGLHNAIRGETARLRDLIATHNGKFDELTLRTIRKAMKKTQFKNPDFMTPGELMDMDRRNFETRLRAAQLEALLGPQGTMRIGLQSADTL